MIRQLTLVASLADILRSSAREIPGYDIRSARVDDEEALSELYLAIYPKEVVKDLAEAREELRMSFEGEYGPLDLNTSFLALEAEKTVAGVLTVSQAPWPDTPPGPFIIEVMVHPEHRRRGLARHLIRETARRLVRAGENTAALRAMSENTGALRLYRRLGFHEWSGETP